MYFVVRRNRYIFLSDSLDEQMLIIVCAHELAHDRLHRELARQLRFREYTIFDVKHRPEYEANIFAAELLLDTDEILKYSRMGYTVGQVASLMGSDPSLVALKAEMLRSEGYELNPQEYRPDFLK